MSDAPAMRELLGADAPTTWGRWGPDDEVGALTDLDAGEVLRGVQHIRSGEVFTLQVHMGRAESPGDPLWPGREGIKRKNELDESTWDGDGGPVIPGGLHYSDDTALPIAEKGIVGRGVLIDMARHRGKDYLDKGETFDHTDLEAAAAAQGVTIEPHDILVIRTGWMKYWYELNDRGKFYDGFTEPGLTYSRELVEWFQQREVPNLVTDTFANEVTFEPETGVALPLHCALMRNLGVTLTEIAWLDDLADACAADGRWSFLYVAAPLKVVNGTGAPVNPVAIR